MPSDSRENSKGRFQVEKDMKFAIKSIVVAAAFVAAGAASAASVTIDNVQTAGDQYVVSGSGALTFSNLLRSALNTGQVAASTYGDATGTITGSVGAYTALVISAPITSITYDDVTGKVSRVITSGGAKQVAGAVDGVSFGGWVQVGELDVRFNAAGTGAEIYGNITGKSDAGTTVSFLGQKLFDVAGYTAKVGGVNTTFAPVVGSTQFTVGTTNTTLNGLSITTAAFDAISTALDLDTLGSSALSAAAKNFGNINSALTVTKVSAPAVPEPSTYALMALGLVGIGAVARRRAAK